MSNKVHVVPVQGRLVPDPERGGFLPSGGRQVIKNQYWMRRFADGDVEFKQPQTNAAKSKKES